MELGHEVHGPEPETPASSGGVYRLWVTKR